MSKYIYHNWIWMYKFRLGLVYWFYRLLINGCKSGLCNARIARFEHYQYWISRFFNIIHKFRKTCLGYWGRKIQASSIKWNYRRSIFNWWIWYLWYFKILDYYKWMGKPWWKNLYRSFSVEWYNYSLWRARDRLCFIKWIWL